MNQYKTSAELKALAKESLWGKYSVSIKACLLYVIITLLSTEVSSIFLRIPGIIGTILYYVSILLITVFTGLFAYGFQFVFLKISCNVPAVTGDLYYGFGKNKKEILKAQLFRSVLAYIACIPSYVFNEMVTPKQLEAYIGVYILLLGLGLLGQFIVTLFYNQTFFIMLDFPEYDAKKALAFSRELMKGNKGRYIYLLVSFIPLLILGMFTFCIGYLWIIPYMQTTFAHFYLDLIQNKH